MAEATFEEIVRAWLLDYDKRLPSNNRERQEAFLVLLSNLKDYGYGKEELNTSKKEKIVRACVNPNHRNKVKLRKWISLVVNDLEDAILIYYGSIKINRNVITPEMSSKLNELEKRAEETKALKTEDDEEEVSENEQPLDLNTSIPLDIEGAVKSAVANPIPQNTFEITDDMLSDIDEPKIVWDEEFSKRLGLDDDEQS